MKESFSTMPHSLTRRRVLTAGATALAALPLIATLGIAPARAQAAGADAFVKSFADQLMSVVNGPQDQAAQRAALQPVINQNVDVDNVARFCLGRFWASATPEQRSKYVSLFHQVLLNNISGHLGEYKGVSIELGNTHEQGGDTLVDSVINRPNQPAANVQWVVSTASGGPKVVDVVAEGTSLRLTQRQDYASYLVHHGNDIDKLIAAMARQLSNG
jgi:phospholipid transport system substrate-binding protein